MQVTEDFEQCVRLSICKCGNALISLSFLTKEAEMAHRRLTLMI